MFLLFLKGAPAAHSFLHTRGGVSTILDRLGVRRVFSPHTWRCFRCNSFCHRFLLVFSTHVEVFLLSDSHTIFPASFLHTRGGVSDLQEEIARGFEFSPHTWRCFFYDAVRKQHERVFSTHVEVFLVANTVIVLGASFLHTRGGVSTDPYRR